MLPRRLRLWLLLQRNRVRLPQGVLDATDDEVTALMRHMASSTMPASVLLVARFGLICWCYWSRRSTVGRCACERLFTRLARMGYVVEMPPDACMARESAGALPSMMPFRQRMLPADTFLWVPCSCGIPLGGLLENRVRYCTKTLNGTMARMIAAMLITVFASSPGFWFVNHAGLPHCQRLASMLGALQQSVIGQVTNFIDGVDDRRIP